MKIKLLGLIFFLISIISCEPLADHVYFIEVQNNSNDSIRCFASYNYPDTTLSVDKPILQLITPHSYTKIESKDSWDKILPKDTIEIFFLSADTLLKYDWNSIKSQYKILKRLDLSLRDIQRLNSIVTYQ